MGMGYGMGFPAMNLGMGHGGIGYGVGLGVGYGAGYGAGIGPGVGGYGWINKKEGFDSAFDPMMGGGGGVSGDFHKTARNGRELNLSSSTDLSTTPSSSLASLIMNRSLKTISSSANKQSSSPSSQSSSLNNGSNHHNHLNNHQSPSPSGTLTPVSLIGSSCSPGLNNGINNDPSSMISISNKEKNHRTKFTINDIIGSDGSNESQESNSVKRPRIEQQQPNNNNHIKSSDQESAGNMLSRMASRHYQ